jgi:YidC/Oxa1 family membrane protein insertase
MEKRIIVAFILSFAVLYGFRWMFPPPEQPAVETSAPAQAGPASPAAATPQAPVPTPATTPAPETAAGDIQAETAENLVVDTPLYTATVSNTGGALTSYTLKAYTDGEGRPLQLINQVAGQKLGWPLVFETSDASLDQMLTKARFRAQQEGDRILLEFAGGGVHARKTLEFKRDNYEFSLQTSLTKDGKDVKHAMVWQGHFGDQSLPPDPATLHVIHETNAAFTRVTAGSITDSLAFNTARAGIEDLYFLAMFLFDSPTPGKVLKQEFPGEDNQPHPALHLSTDMPDGKAVRVFVGPKEQRWLSKADPLLPSVINYGWFEIVAKPLLLALLWIHSYVGNFGWAIIILTVVLNLALFPLRLKQQVSMLKMQKIQPQMRTLQDRYKKLKANDPRRAEVQSQMMGLYKEHGVNPLGGCFPLLLQMPVLIGLYSMLSVSIELRRAPWLGWITDLSRPEMLLIPVLPILMTISMIVMQKMTPTTVDPAQAKMMMIMPIMFLFMFWRAQSGLTLYWLTGNVIGIAQQVFINKYWSPRTEAKLGARKSKESRDNDKEK